MKCKKCGKKINLEDIDSYSFKDKNSKLEAICNECNIEKQEVEEIKIKKDKPKLRPIGIIIFPIIIILFNIYYWFPVYSGNWEPETSIFSTSLFAIFFWFTVILVIIALYAVTIGFFYAKNWARLYEIGYLSYSSFWAIISMFVIDWQVIEHYIYFIIYVFLIAYLLQSPIKEYFKFKKTIIKL